MIHHHDFEPRPDRRPERPRSQPETRAPRIDRVGVALLIFTGTLLGSMLIRLVLAIANGNFPR